MIAIAGESHSFAGDANGGGISCLRKIMVLSNASEHDSSKFAVLPCWKKWLHLRFLVCHLIRGAGVRGRRATELRA